MVLESLLKTVQDSETLGELSARDEIFPLVVAWFNNYASQTGATEPLNESTTGKELKSKVLGLTSQQKLEIAYLTMGLAKPPKPTFEERAKVRLKHSLLKWTFALFCFLVTLSAVFSGISMIKSDLPADQSLLTGLIGTVVEIFKLLFSMV